MFILHNETCKGTQRVAGLVELTGKPQGLPAPRRQHMHLETALQPRRRIVEVASVVSGSSVYILLSCDIIVSIIPTMLSRKAGYTIRMRTPP
jgi:hypothetical protein